MTVLGYLQVPLQRIGKMTLLVQTALREIDANHENYVLLEEAYAALNEVFSTYNLQSMIK